MNSKLTGYFPTRKEEKMAEVLFGNRIDDVSQQDLHVLKIYINLLKKNCEKLLSLNEEDYKKIYKLKKKEQFKNEFFDILSNTLIMYEYISIFMSCYVKEEFEVYDEEKVNSLCDEDYNKCIEDHKNSTDPGWIKYFNHCEEDISENEAFLRIQHIIEKRNTPLITP